MNTTINNGWRTLSVCLLLSLATLLPTNATAQSDVADKDRSSVIVEIDLQRLMKSPLVKKEQLQQLSQLGVLPFDPGKAKRVFATAQAPSDFSEVATMEPGKPLPFNFIMQVDFADSESAKSMLEPMEKVGSKEVKKNGKTFLAPDDPSAPENLWAHIAKEKTFEMGTEDYITKNSRDFLSKKLNSIWSKNPKPNAIRISIDVESNRKFVKEAMKVARREAPPQMQGFLAIVDDVSTLSLAVDLDNANLLSIVATAKDEESTKNLNAAINGLLGMGRLMGTQALSAGDMDEASQNTMKELLGSLKTKVNANEVTVTVPKPAGFKAMMEKLQEGG